MMNLDLNTPSTIIESFISKHPDWMFGGRVINSEKAGEGNMNLVLRVFFDNGQHMILKQSKPYVQKYPHIPAPVQRIEVEHAFYQSIASNEWIKSTMPDCLGFDTADHILALEDLGKGSDYTYLYQRNSVLADFPGQSAVQYLSHLHNHTWPNDYPANMELRLLNAEHLFVYPYQTTPGFDLDQIQPGLHDLAQPLLKDKTLKYKVNLLRDDYLAAGTSLIHGDFYPGSWLNTTSGFKVIDPEFSFIGSAAYDMGVLIAHLKMARSPDQTIDDLLAVYQSPSGFDMAQVWPIAGMEIIRRLIGLAQLPLDHSLEEKKGLLDWASNCIIG